jgi:arginine repressor
VERKFRLLPAAVQVSLEHGKKPEDIVQILVDAASFARAKALHDLLVVSGIDDPATTAAVSRALDEIHAMGAPQPFRIAFVAYTLPQYSVYHFAERYAHRFGIDAKVLVSVRDAEDWLGLRGSPSPVAPAEMRA